MQKKILLLAFVLISFIFLSSIATAGTLSAKSFSGTFSGTDPTITVGGNCPPINVKMDVTGICTGSGYREQVNSWGGDINYWETKEVLCTAPQPNGFFQRHWTEARLNTQSIADGVTSGWVRSYAPNGTLLCSTDGQYIWSWQSYPCSAETTQNFAGQNFKAQFQNGNWFSKYMWSTSLICTARTYYTPCTLDPQVIVDGVTWKYSGLVTNTQTVSIPIGTNSNPRYKNEKVPKGNLKIGNNLLDMSAQESAQFKYTVYWTEESVAGSSDADGDGYYTNACTLGNDCDDNNPNVNPGVLEKPNNGLDDNCDGLVDSINITHMNNITTFCPYSSTTRTYYCGNSTHPWNNVYITNTISLPTDSGNSRNIIFNVKDKLLIEKDFSATGGGDREAGHSGGLIKADANNITVLGSLNAQGSGCCPKECCSESNCNDGGPGGEVNLKSYYVKITGSINSGGGSAFCKTYNRGGSGGRISIITNTIDIGSYLSANGANANNGGSGGTINISATRNISVAGTVSANGGISSGGGYCPILPGGSGGTIILKSQYGSIGIKNSITVDGGTGVDSTAGWGGNINITGKSVNAKSISANGGNSGGGSIFVESDYYLNAGTISANAGPAARCSTPGPGGTITILTNSYFAAPAISANGGTGGAGYSGTCDTCGSAPGSTGGKIKIRAFILNISNPLSAGGGSGGSDGSCDTFLCGFDGSVGGRGGSISLIGDIVKSSSAISANGGSGGSGGGFCRAGAAGGTGGKIIFYADALNITDYAYAKGGDGGTPSQCNYCWTAAAGVGGTGGGINIFAENYKTVEYEMTKYLRMEGGIGGKQCTVSGYCCRDCNCPYSEKTSDGAFGLLTTNLRKTNALFNLQALVKELPALTDLSGTFSLRTRDSATYQYLKDQYNNVWNQTGKVLVGKINEVVGSNRTFSLSLVKPYWLELFISNDAKFSEARCMSGEAKCDFYSILFSVYSQ